MLKGRRSLYSMVFKIKVSVEAEAVKKTLKLLGNMGKASPWYDAGEKPSEYSFWQAFFELSAKCAKMGCFTPKYPELDHHVMEWFS